MHLACVYYVCGVCIWMYVHMYACVYVCVYTYDCVSMSLYACLCVCTGEHQSMREEVRG